MALARQRFREAGSSDAPTAGSRPRAASKGSWAVQPSAAISLARALIAPGWPLNPELTAFIVPGPRTMRTFVPRTGRNTLLGYFKGRTAVLIEINPVAVRHVQCCALYSSGKASNIVLLCSLASGNFLGRLSVRHSFEIARGRVRNSQRQEARKARRKVPACVIFLVTWATAVSFTLLHCHTVVVGICITFTNRQRTHCVFVRVRACERLAACTMLVGGSLA